MDKSTFLVYRISSIAMNIWSIIPIIMSLFFVILRRLYINFPYHRHIRKYIIYIVLQFVIKSLTACIVQTRYLSLTLYFPFGVIDTCIYISTSHKFYNLLKGIRNASRLHSQESIYYENVRIVNHFFFAQIITLLLISVVLVAGLTSLISVPLCIIAYNPCFLSYVTLGMIPTLPIPKRIQDPVFPLGRRSAVRRTDSVLLLCRGRQIKPNDL